MFPRNLLSPDQHESRNQLQLQRVKNYIVFVPKILEHCNKKNNKLVLVLQNKLNKIFSFNN